MTQGNDMGTDLLYLSPCLLEKMLQGDRYKRTVPCVPLFRDTRGQIQKDRPLKSSRGQIQKDRPLKFP